MKFLQRLGSYPIHLLIMIIIGGLSTLCAACGAVYWLITRNVESQLYMVASATVALFGWGMYGLQWKLPTHRLYAQRLAPTVIFAVMALISLYDPIGLKLLWVAIVFFPIMLSLMVERRAYAYGSLLFLLYFIAFHWLSMGFKGSGNAFPILDIIAKNAYAIGSVLLGALIQLTVRKSKRDAEIASLHKQKQQVINMLQSFIPVGERKTQTSRKEIGEMSALLKKLVHVCGGVSVQEWEIDLLSLMHFVSRVKLPDYLFEKEGKLSEFEYEVVHEHCYMARELCEGIPDFQEVERTFLYHHEKIDGTGYPYRLVGAQVPALSQMLGIVEMYLAMTTPRSYREENSKQEAFLEIQKHSGTSFRADIVEAFGKVIR
ncbi:HD-GYP domain-containing protein [Paenibacillus whitsoniae]|uniref:HD-GYP domain-containing protein n=1 Tax=Paenibacillus whitsoniae TaxID=2496558 RepID=A0A430JBD4_9BACL|nr:HD domain-containing phosphohydrolase [Paenibacillus whitsoniae]RTE08337.1 hypothetical protein EJQ19_18105 [Paenibacillus whitsoniae]